MSTFSLYDPALLPEVAVNQSVESVLNRLRVHLGATTLEAALTPAHTIPSPLEQTYNTDWIRSVNMVGINVRTIGNFWNVVAYAFTLPACQQAVHLLPIWEPGVVDSLYGMASWRINPEFFSTELAAARPHLNTVEQQLKVVVNILHAMGKTVGMDVIHHTDRYSEIALANPSFFEWLQRQDTVIKDHSAKLYQKVEAAIWQFLQQHGAATIQPPLPATADIFFYAYMETDRARLLFGEASDQIGRNQRRALLVQWLYQYGYEPVPATMGPPYRGLEVNMDQHAKTTDSQGLVWRDYAITAPQPMSRVFGPLARYQLYEALDDNRQWVIDFNRPRYPVWQYVCENYAAVARAYHFDFMRGDMSHVQMRPDGVPHEVDTYYDLHKAVKSYIQREKPWFAYFAESFLAPPNVIAYGDEVDHLEQSDAEATLGDLQSMVLGSPTFLQHFRRYLDILQTRTVAPAFTMMTGDKDDPRFDHFYLKGNEARFFVGLFLTDMPSYMALGFECRDPHPTPAPNEHYTKLYVFRLVEGEKKTTGPYVWGKNHTLFAAITRIRQLAEQLLPELHAAPTRWLLPPDATAGVKVIAWTQLTQPRFVFVVNLDIDQSAINIKIPHFSTTDPTILTPIFSTHQIKIESKTLITNGKQYQLDHLAAGEGLVLAYAAL